MNGISLLERLEHGLLTQHDAEQSYGLRAQWIDRGGIDDRLHDRRSTHAGAKREQIEVPRTRWHSDHPAEMLDGHVVVMRPVAVNAPGWVPPGRHALPQPLLEGFRVHGVVGGFDRWLGSMR